MIKQFFLTACLVFLTASFLLLWDSPPESFLRPDASKVENLPSADSYMSNINSIAFSSDGARKYTLKASQIAIFSGLSELKLSEPLLIAFKTGSQQAQFEIKANSGTLFKSTKTFKFDDNVNAYWETSEGSSLLQAGNLAYVLNEESVYASDGVQLTSPDSEISGDSLSVNFDSKEIKIESRVRGVHDSI